MKVLGFIWKLAISVTFIMVFSVYCTFVSVELFYDEVIKAKPKRESE